MEKIRVFFSAFDHFVGLALKGFNFWQTFEDAFGKWAKVLNMAWFYMQGLLRFWISFNMPEYASIPLNVS